MLNATLYPFQAEAVDKMVRRRSLLLALVMGAGKGHPDGTAILTPSGYVNVEDLRVGDSVVGSDGLPTKVTGVYPRGVQPCFRVSFNDGTSTVVDADHLWYVESPADRCSNRRGKVLATWMLATDDHTEAGQCPGGKRFATYFRDRHGNNRWSIPIGSPPQFGQVDLPIDPYTLGVILGDGSIKPSSVIVHCHADDAHEMSGLVHGAGDPRPAGSCWQFSIYDLLPKLRELRLMGAKTYTKFIPHAYLTASPAQRLALLQGLMDTDGYSGKRGTVEFVSVSQHLAEGVAYLARSLGAYAYLRRKQTSCTYNGSVVPGVAWRVTFKMDQVPFRLSRKVAAYRSPVKYRGVRVITNVEPVPPRATTCISVAATDQLYVIHDFIVTHNTVTTLAALDRLIEEGSVRRAVIVVPASLKYQWQREIKKFTDHTSLVIDGTPRQRELLYNVAHRFRFMIINYEAIVNDWDRVRSMQFDAIAIDEATTIKSFRAKRSKKLKQFGSKIPVRFALTGQPIENRPEDLFSIMQFVDSSVLGNFELFDRTFIVRDYFGRPQNYRNLPLLRQRMESCMVRKTREDIADQLPTVVPSVVPVVFSRAEAKLYNKIAGRLLLKLDEATQQFGREFNLFAHYTGEGGAEMQMQGEVMSMLLALRLVCDDASLLVESAKEFEAEGEGGSQFAYDLYVEGLLDNVPPSTKHAELVALVDELLADDPATKIVLFSTFKGVLHKIKAHYGDTAVEYTGDMNAKQKDRAKQSFKTDPNVRLFLSSDAGGYGVDIPEANYLISFDLPWSTGKYEQREARIIRLSSEWEKVYIMSLLVEGSVEQRIYDVLQQKKGVADAFLDGRYDEKGRFELTMSSLRKFLEESSV